MMKKGLFAVLALLIVFAMIGCDTGSNPGPGPGPGGDGFVVPTDWVRFTEAEMLAAKFYIGSGGDNPISTSITKNADGSYSVTLQTYPEEPSYASVVWVEFDDVVFRNGWYASLTLPTTGGDVRPVQVDVVPVPKDKKGSDGGIAWPQSQNNKVTGDLPATMDGLYVVGDLSMHWGTEELQDQDFIGLAIWLTWAPVTTGGEDYTFTIKDLAVLPHSGEDPELSAWQDPSVETVPNTWIDFSSPTISASSPGGATITASGTGYTIKTKTTTGDHTEITFNKADFKFKDGYYLSLTLPNSTLASTNKVRRIYTYAKNGTTSNWGSAVDIQQAFKWLQGKVDCKYPKETWESLSEHDTIVLSIYWHPGVVADQDYEFTINSFKVAEESAGPPPLYIGVVPRVHAYLQETTNWGGTWDNQFDETNTYSIDFTTTLATATAYDQFLLDLYFPGDAVGKDYQFTLSELKILDSSNNNTITEAEILNGSRGGNPGNGYTSQSGVVTKSANGYLVKMTIIKDIDWQNIDSGYGITTLVIPWASTAPVKTYSFKAELPEPEEQGLENWGSQPNPPAEPTGSNITSFLSASPVLTGGATLTGDKIAGTIAPNWDASKIVVNAIFTVAGKTFDGGFYVLVNLPNDPAAQVTGVMVQGGDNAFNGTVGWVAGVTVSAPAGKYMTGDVAVAWNGKTWGEEPAGAAPAEITIQLIFAPGTASAPYEYTIKKLLVGGLN
ncbi:MAG: hypothetical protein LBC52_00510 [Treponema sp.]|jgi:hypothetical protein|nr:hypothetical protein [Treponema sp.]